MTDDKDTLWRTIATDLRAAIRDGRYPPGGPLPSEPELVRRYNVSRPTVRKAVDALVSEGLAYVMRGRGSFVRPIPEREIILITDTERPDLAAPGNHPLIRAYGWELGLRDTDTLQRTDSPPFHGERTTATRETAALLRLRPAHPVIHRTSHWSPFEINSWTNADLIPDFDDPKRNSQYRKRATFFYQTLQRDHGPITWATFITARIAYDDERTRLRLDSAEAILIIHRTMTDPSGRILEVTEVKASASRYEIAYAAEIGHRPNALPTINEPADDGIALLI